jgi:hypothetical protein
MPLDITIDIVAKGTDQYAQHSTHYILSTGTGSHPHQHTKPTLQPEKTVEHKPAAADQKIKTLTGGKHTRHSASNHIVDMKPKPGCIHNNNNSDKLKLKLKLVTTPVKGAQCVACTRVCAAGPAIWGNNVP